MDSVQHFSVWLSRHGSILQHLSLDFEGDLEDAGLEGCDPLGSQLATALQCCSSLRSLNLGSWGDAVIPIDLHHFRQLRSFRMGGYLDEAALARFGRWTLTSLPAQLKALKLCVPMQETYDKCDVQRLLARLPDLTHLDLLETGLRVSHLGACPSVSPSLPPLQELKLEYNPKLDSLEALGKLPCTFLHWLVTDSKRWQEHIQQFVEWSAAATG